MRPGELVNLLNSLWRVFDELVLASAAIKIETLGPVYLLAAGLPTPHPEHAAGARVGHGTHLLAVLFVRRALFGRRASFLRSG